MRLKDEKATLGVRPQAGAVAEARRRRDPVGAAVGGQDDAGPRACWPRLGKGEVPSPSFAIVQPYEDCSPPVWHVDLYRIENPVRSR